MGKLWKNCEKNSVEKNSMGKVWKIITHGNSVEKLWKTQCEKNVQKNNKGKVWKISGKKCEKKFVEKMGKK